MRAARTSSPLRPLLRRTSVARLVWGAVACALCLLALRGRALAETEARVVVISAIAPDARLSHVLRLIRGELAGLGLDAELREDPAPASVVGAPAGAYGALVIEASEAAISVRAFAPGETKPVVESIDLDSAGVDAEVVAVRAVETLRAALLPFAQAHRAELSPAARGFARVAEPAAVSPPPATEKKRPLTPRVAAPRGTRNAMTPWVELAIGPNLLLNTSSSPLFDAQGVVLLGHAWGFVALGAESSLFRAELAGTGGHAEITRRALSGQVGARLRRREWELATRLGVSYLNYAVHGVAEPGYLARDLRHQAAAASLTLSLAYYFVPSLGAYLSLSGLCSFDAARVRVAERDVGTLDQPSLALGAGALLGVF